MSENQDMWATVELMGNAQTAGRISRPSDFGGLLRVDVPDPDVDGQYRTEFYGMAAIYSVKIVSEEIARAFATHQQRQVIAYDTPIVTREQHQLVVNRMEREQTRLYEHIAQLKQRLVTVNALPVPAQREDDDCDDSVRGFVK